MKNIIAVLLCLSVQITIYAQNSTSLNNVIPKPLSVTETKGVFTFYKNTSIESPSSLLNAKKLLESHLQNYAFPTTKVNSEIEFVQATEKEKMAKEGYKIAITPTLITITSKSIQGALLATNTLVQIQLLQNNAQQIPCGVIIDSPRFEYRGMHQMFLEIFIQLVL